VWLISQLRDRGLMEDVWLQHDGAPAHFALTVCDILNKHFLGCWNGHGSPTSPTPLSWSPCSPDLTTPDNSLWALSRDKWLRTTIATMTSCTELWNRSSPPLCHKCFSACHTQHGCIRLCYEHDGAHTDPLDVQWLSPHGKLSRGTVTSRPPCTIDRLC
jgi:hypothetical protein